MSNEGFKKTADNGHYPAPEPRLGQDHANGWCLIEGMPGYMEHAFDHQHQPNGAKSEAQPPVNKM